MHKVNSLYIGLDDSNHGEQKKRIGEIIVLTYSYNPKHCWEPRKMANRRAYSEVFTRFKEGIFDYVFTLIPHQIAKINYSNLPIFFPFLLDNILLKRNTEILKAGLDGRLSRRDRVSLRTILEEDFSFSEITIKNFIKRNGVHLGPPLIYFADVISNSLFNSSINRISKNPKFIPISKNQLENYLNKFTS